MKEPRDPWYVRLPDGRVMKAKSTSAVRHHIEAGHIPLNSFVRRDPNEEWQALAWVQEFSNQNVGGSNRSPASMSDIPPPPEQQQKQISSSAQDFINAVKSGVSERLDPLKLQTVGVRGFVDEMLAAFDSVLNPNKLLIGVACAMILYAGLLLSPQIIFQIHDEPASWLIGIIQLVFAIGIFSVMNTLLTRQTHLELSRMQAIPFSETIHDFARYLVPVFIATLVIAGGSAVAFYFLTEIPIWLAKQLSGEINENLFNIIMTPLPALLLVLGMLLWLIIGLCWLIPPAIVVEESSWMSGIREWRMLIKEHWTRILVYESMAIFFGILLSLPFVMAMGMTMTNQPSILPTLPSLKVEMVSWSKWVQGGLLEMIKGGVAAPFLCFLAVANVFIYLNLRYEYSQQK